MTRPMCPTCRLRFASESTAILTSCPRCGGDLQAVASAEATLGYRLFGVGELSAVFPVAVAMAQPMPADRPDQT